MGNLLLITMNRAALRRQRTQVRFLSVASVSAGCAIMREILFHKMPASVCLVLVACLVLLKLIKGCNLLEVEGTKGI